jgi:uncharacterized protein YecA (UPF0149 family)
MSENTVLGSNLNMVTPELTEQLNVNDFYPTEQPLNIMDVATEEMTQSQETNITKLAESIASLEQNAPSIESIVGTSEYSKFALRKQKQLVKEYKIGRNDTCPCGSGKKYKHCCLKSGVYENYITK